MCWVFHTTALEVVDNIVTALSLLSDIADACNICILTSSIKIDEKAFCTRNTFRQSKSSAMRFQLDRGAFASTLFVEAKALVAAV